MFSALDVDNQLLYLLVALFDGVWDLLGGMGSQTLFQSVYVQWTLFVRRVHSRRLLHGNRSDNRVLRICLGECFWRRQALVIRGMSKMTRLLPDLLDWLPINLSRLVQDLVVLL